MQDRAGRSRVTGEEWLINKPGAYLPGPHEEIVGTITAHKLNNKVALHVAANQTFVDRFGKKRKAGEEWLVTEKVGPFIHPCIEKFCNLIRYIYNGMENFL